MEKKILNSYFLINKYMNRPNFCRMWLKINEKKLILGLISVGHVPFKN